MAQKSRLVVYKIRADMLKTSNKNVFCLLCLAHLLICSVSLLSCAIYCAKSFLVSLISVCVRTTVNFKQQYLEKGLVSFKIKSLRF